MIQITVNGTPLRGWVLTQLIAAGVKPGRYWLDPTAKPYGFEGGPTMGVSQLHIANVGPLHPHASCRGQTNIVINTREVHPREVLYLFAHHAGFWQPLDRRWKLDSLSG